MKIADVLKNRYGIDDENVEQIMNRITSVGEKEFRYFLEHGELNCNAERVYGMFNANDICIGMDMHAIGAVVMLEDFIANPISVLYEYNDMHVNGDNKDLTQLMHRIDKNANGIYFYIEKDLETIAEGMQ